MAKIAVKHGTEGPHYDLYSWTEICFTKSNGDEVVVRCSTFSGWIKLNGFRMDEQPDDNDNGAGLNRKFKQLTGMYIQEAEELYQRFQNPSKCRKCGSKSFEDFGGFPGESITGCKKCGEVISYHFNESAII